MRESDDLAVIEFAAVWTAQFATGIVEAHKFGYGPGPEGSLITGRFQTDAVPLFAQALPEEHLQAMSAAFSDIGDQMVSRGAPIGLSEPWEFLSRWFQIGAGEVKRQGSSGLSFDAQVDLMRDFTPSVLPFTLLAEIASVEGAIELFDISLAVATGLKELQKDRCPLSAEGLELIGSLAAGRRVVDIAEALGHSERSMYRSLHRVWATLGVDSRAEGLALAARRGWI